MGNRIEVTRGISSGAKVVLRPAETLSSGSKITTEK
jgi:hypothetical protein